ncbi:MAG: hypothetical protein OEZ06_01540 [Myxococcales bacterium]|nr:hypothetical protein [Myxococcales bacterium]
MLTAGRLVDIEALGEKDATGRRPDLEAHLRALMKALPELSVVITQGYLAHAIPQQSLGPRTGPDEDVGDGPGADR